MSSGRREQGSSGERWRWWCRSPGDVEPLLALNALDGAPQASKASGPCTATKHPESGTWLRALPARSAHQLQVTDSDARCYGSSRPGLSAGWAMGALCRRCSQTAHWEEHVQVEGDLAGKGSSGLGQACAPACEAALKEAG